MSEPRDPPVAAAVPTLSLRITVVSRRARFAVLLSRLTGLPVEAAWNAFPPLPGPDGPWGVPQPAPRGNVAL